MTHLEIEAMTAAIAPVIRQFVEKVLQDKDRKIERLEAKLIDVETEMQRLKLKEGPPGKDGRDGIDGKDGAPGIDGKDGAPGAAGRDGVDGLPGVDGSPGDRGLDGPPGKDGRDGRDGQAGLNGKDGEPGRDGADGKDGLGFDDMHVEDFADHFEIRFVQGERSKIFPLRKPPSRSLVDSYRGIWRDEISYSKGDCVTHGGSLHLAHDDSVGAKPGTSPAWQCIVKRGNDGRNGKDGEKGDRGPEGRPGKDLTQMGPDGAKWR